MKRLTILFVICFVFACLTSAEEINLDKLKASHIVAMKYYGHASILAEKDNKMVFMAVDKGFASVCYGKELASAYMEIGAVKHYWYVEKTKTGVILSSKVNIAGAKYSRSVEVNISDAEISIRQRPDMDEGSRVNCDWGCLASKFFKCITCATDWKCWLTCAGPGIWECCQW